MSSFSIVVAATQRGGIGKAGQLPWRLPGDMKFFKHITSDCPPSKINAVILGRNTWESIPPKFRPLANRINVVLSRQPEFGTQLEHLANVKVVNSFTAALSYLGSEDIRSRVHSIFVVGGAAVYIEALTHPGCDKVYWTNVLKDISCDTFIPLIDPRHYELQTLGDVVVESEIPYQILTYARRAARRHEEYQYLDLIAEVIREGNPKGDRTGTGTLSKFGRQMRFSLRDNSFPLLTTKTVFWRGVVEELLWLIKGCTDSKELSNKRIKIWDGNGSREFLDKNGHSHREVGDLGPVYGHQWRHFGAPYVSCHTDYKGQGVDQLADVIHRIKTNPEDRRIIMSAWNPCDLKAMALPPCHVLCQFYVYNGELSCLMYQRSCDLGLGVPFNIASYSLLTRMIAQVCGLRPGDFIHVLGDTHVYKNHIEPLKEQLQREPTPFPKLEINPAKKDIDDFTFDDFKLVGYQPHGPIKMEMAV